MIFCEGMSSVASSQRLSKGVRQPPDRVSPLACHPRELACFGLELKLKGVGKSKRSIKSF